MLMRILLIIGLASVVLMGSGCVNISKSPAEVGEKEVKDLLETAGKEIVEGIDVSGILSMDTEIEDFPTGIPLPEQFIVLVDSNISGMRQVSIEIGESDIPALVAKFNEIFSSTGVEGVLEEGTHKSSGNYQAIGNLKTEEGVHYRMAVSENGPDDDPLIDGNTGVISYMIMP